MNYVYYKNSADTRGPHTSTKKKPAYKKSKHSAGSGHDFACHSEGCRCDACTSELHLRTHLLLDMSCSRGDPQVAHAHRSSSASKFTLFGSRPKKPPPSSAGGRDENKRLSGKVSFRGEDDIKGADSGSREHPSGSGMNKDCFMIPAGRMSRFFPAGQRLPCPGGEQGRLRMMETPEPNIRVVFHMMTIPTPVSPSLQSPLHDPHQHQKESILKAFKTAATSVSASSGCLQGMVLLNLERVGELGAIEFPFMVVWIVDGRLCDTATVVQKVRQLSLESLDPVKTGFICQHSFDLYEEVATLARPPLEKLPRKATTPTTGYIISVFRVFEGDDRQKFERNWLTWTGARTLYESLTPEVGLRRITLHKSNPQKGFLHYVLLCDCNNFLSQLTNAAQAVPRLRMRLCGDTGLYRPICTL